MATCLSCGNAVPEGETRCPVCGAALPSPTATDVSAPVAAAPVAAEVQAPAGGGTIGVPAAGAATAAPVSDASAVPGTAPNYSSLGDRMLAVVLDTLVLVAIGWALGMVAAPWFGGATTEGFNLTGAPALIVIGLSALLFLTYCVCLEWWFGATLGKVVVGAKVGATDGARLDFRRSLIRNLFRLIDGIGVYLVAGIAVLVTRRRQRLGDLAAGTIVTRREYPGFGRAIALLLLVALPVAAIAGTWSRRATPTGESTDTTSTTTTTTASDASRGAGGTPPERTSGAAGGATLGPVSDGPFTLSNIRAAEGPDGPDLPSATCKPGGSVTLRYDVSGFDTSPGKGRVRLSFSARDPFDVVVIKPAESIQEPPAGETSLGGWARVSLPEYAWPGTYHIDLAMADLVANRQVSASAPFTVEGISIEPSDSLILRNFRVTEGDGGPTRANASYRAGDTLWVAFDIVGFKGDAEGMVRLKAEMVVATGSQRGPQQQLFELNDRFSYVPKRLPATSHLTLGGMSPGDYVMTLIFTDGVGNQRSEQPVRFTIQQ